MTDFESELLSYAVDGLLQEMDGKDNVTLRQKVFTFVTRTGKQVQLQIVATDIELLRDFTAEETKHYRSFKDYKQKKK